MTETYPQNRRLGYARVSTYGQTLDAQLEQLRGAGCTKIYREKVTGAHNDRRQLLKMLAALAPGDVVMVTRIDRLARSTFDLFAIVKQIVDSKAQFQSLAEPWADTGTSTGRLMIAVLGGLADVERDLIRTRTAEGRSRALKRGQHWADPPNSPTHRRPKHGGGGRRARPLPNSRAATAWARARFHGWLKRIGHQIAHSAERAVTGAGKQGHRPTARDSNHGPVAAHTVRRGRSCGVAMSPRYVELRLVFVT
jgi:DNA invertase Pin-like site-specific DNA recombinase